MPNGPRTKAFFAAAFPVPVTSPILTVMIAAARKAARKLVRDFGEVEQLQVSLKGPADFVSQADIQAEKTLHAELSRARPDFGFLMEEGGAIAGQDPDNRWIIDPLDGTINFLHGLPHFAISIAHESGGVLNAGIIYDPVRDEMFRGERGKGAFLNDRRLRVSVRRALENSVLATGIPCLGRDPHPAYLHMLDAVMGACVGVRRCGSAALDLAYVAAGRYEGFWEIGLKPWDLAAGILLVREAGGMVSDLEGGETMMESGDILATNDLLDQPIAHLLRDAIGKKENPGRN
jgi:myo-inositol-1(or 4)-monophosphatase